MALWNSIIKNHTYSKFLTLRHPLIRTPLKGYQFTDSQYPPHYPDKTASGVSSGTYGF